MRRLYKSRRDRVIDGVCGGIAEYFDIDPVIVRLIAVILLFTGGTGLIAYIVGMIIIPANPEGEGYQPCSHQAHTTGKTNHKNKSAAGVILIIIGVLLLMHNIPVFRGYYWWIRSLSWEYIVPVAFIIIGLYFLIKKGEEKKDTEGSFQPNTPEKPDDSK